MANQDDSSRIIKAEQRSRAKELLDRCSLGSSNARKHIERSRAHSAADSERWIRVADLPRLLEIYREQRENWKEDHYGAVAYVLSEVDFTPDQHDIGEQYRF